MRLVDKWALIVPAAAVTVVLASMVAAFQVLSPVTASASERFAIPMMRVGHGDREDIPTFSIDTISNDVLWLARCIYSETKRPDEQELVAWVVRNRVETRYRGESTYMDVVLDPYQFSAFNAGSRKRRFYVGLSPYADARGWTRTMKIAHDVYYSEAEARPFVITTRHFYSERSMVGRSAPSWARGRSPVRLINHQIDERRFRFYAGIS